MPKVTIEFDLPDEGHEHDAAMKGVDALAVIGNVDSHLRGRIKYAGLAEDVEKALQRVRDLLREDCISRGIVLCTSPAMENFEPKEKAPCNASASTSTSKQAPTLDSSGGQDGKSK